MSSSVRDLEPVSDYPGASPWFSAVSTPAVLRPGPHMAALQSSRFARTWCDGCGRRRGADGRCPVCDPWWTSPFYVYGSFLTVAVATLLLTILPLLRTPSPNSPANPPGSPTVAVLVSSPGFAPVGTPVVQIAAPPAAPLRRPALTVPAPLVAAFPQPPTQMNAGLGNLARLRAMTDYAAGMETRREATRAWSGISPQRVVPLPVVQFPQPTTVAPRSPTAVTPPSEPSPGNESTGANGEGDTSTATAPQRTL